MHIVSSEHSLQSRDAPVDVAMAINSAPAASLGDAFDGSAEPIMYMSENRMPVLLEFNSAIIYIVFAALLLALVSILPGIRKTKWTSFLGLSTIILLGATILLALDGSHWLVGSLQIYEAPYGALTTESITGRLEVNIGLSSTNVTLLGRLMGASNNLATGDEATSKTVNYNERFNWDQPERMAEEHVQALRRGLPYPILTITEFLSQDSDGFNWMRQLRRAGYFTALALKAALASWGLTCVVMCVLPVYLPHMVQITGALLMASVWLYTLLVQSPKSFVIQLRENPIEFAFGHTYVITFVVGAVSMFAGVLLFVLQISKPNSSQFTIMDSEDFQRDKSALAAAPHENKPEESAKAKQQTCVMIPIADIEQNFNMNSK